MVTDEYEAMTYRALYPLAMLAFSSALPEHVYIKEIIVISIRTPLKGGNIHISLKPDHSSHIAVRQPVQFRLYQNVFDIAKFVKSGVF